MNTTRLAFNLQSYQIKMSLYRYQQQMSFPLFFFFGSRELATKEELFPFPLLNIVYGIHVVAQGLNLPWKLLFQCVHCTVIPLRQHVVIGTLLSDTLVMDFSPREYQMAYKVYPTMKIKFVFIKTNVIYSVNSLKILKE